MAILSRRLILLAILLYEQFIRGLSQKFVDNMGNFVQTCGGKHIKTTAILPIIMTIYTQNLNEMSLSLMTLCNLKNNGSNTGGAAARRVLTS